jgi:hypothetical protein
MTAFLSLRDAIAEYVQDGATLAMEGFTHLIPFTFLPFDRTLQSSTRNGRTAQAMSSSRASSGCRRRPRSRQLA